MAKNDGLLKAKSDTVLSLMRCNGRLWRQSSATYLITQGGQGVATASVSTITDLMDSGLLKIIDNEIRAA